MSWLFSSTSSSKKISRTKGKNDPSRNAQHESFVRSQVEESLQNIESAHTLANRAIDENMRKQAMQIYQSSIAVLIQVMNSEEPLPKGLDKESLSQHVNRALTRAEHLKTTISPNTKKSSISGGKKSNKLKPSPSSSNYPKNTDGAIQQKSHQSSNIISSPHLKNPLYPLISGTIHISPKSLQNVTLTSLSGLDFQKQAIQNSILQPLQHPNLYTGLRTPPAGILLYGPPGTGKTMLVKAIAYETREQTMFFSCSSATLSSKWHGEGEKILWLLFQIAREVAPSIIFLDEMDALLGRRGGTGGNNASGGGSGESETARRFKTEFMVQMDGMMSENNSKKRLWVIGCTNTPWDLDDAILRRMEVRIYVPLPDKYAREAMLLKLLEQNTHSMTRRDIQSLVEITNGYSSSDLRTVGREAAFGPLRDLNLSSSSDKSKVKKLRPISYKDFQRAVKVSSRSVSPFLLQRFKEWEKVQGNAV